VLLLGLPLVHFDLRALDGRDERVPYFLDLGLGAAKPLDITRCVPARGDLADDAREAVNRRARLLTR
jgi:hypothetical protein